MAIELGTAYFTLLPSMAGTAAAVKTGLGATAVTGAFSSAGTAGGAAMAGGVAGGLSKGVPVIAGAIAALGIANLFGDSINAASDLNESANAVRVSFGEASGEIAKLGESSAERLGLAQKDFNSLAVRFSSFAATIAGDGGDIAAVIDELTTRGADFASVYNIEAADALALFQSGLAGESEPLRRFGLDLSAASVANTAYRLGIAEVGAELTEQEKIQARYAAILEQTAQVEGDRANTADEFANQQRENAARWEDSLARIGAALLPVATQFAAWVGNEQNQELLGRLVDLFVKLEPVLTATGDALLFIVDMNIATPLTLWFDFFEALEDGVITLEEAVAMVRKMPEPLQNLLIGMVNFMAGAVNPIIDAVNSVGDAIENLINGASRLLGLRQSITFANITRLGGVSIAPSGGAPLYVNTRQANGGRTVGAGLSWVGEHGAELMWMPEGAEVTRSDASAAGLDLSAKSLRVLVEAIMSQRVLEADGQAIAATTNRGNQVAAALGAA